MLTFPQLTLPQTASELNHELRTLFSITQGTRARGVTALQQVHDLVAEIGAAVNSVIATPENADMLELARLTPGKTYCASVLLALFTLQTQLFNKNIAKAKTWATCAFGEELMEWAVKGLSDPKTRDQFKGELC